MKLAMMWTGDHPRQKPLLPRLISQARTIWSCNGRTLRMLHGQNAEDAYAEYITGKRSYMDITLELRR